MPGPSRRVAFLRGINVGGARVLRMEALRHAARQAGLADVATVGASGNLLYRSGAPAASDAQALARALAPRLPGVLAVVRDAAQMRRLAAADRFAAADAGVPDKWRFVAFLAAPSRAALPEMPAGGPLAIVGRTASEVFYTMREPASAALAMAGRLDRALGSRVTVRNWNVVRDVAARLAAPAREDA